MRFEPDPEAVRWLEGFGATALDFEWDHGNWGKNMKHRVMDAEIESVFRQVAYVFAGKIVDPAHEEWRGLVLGETESRRRLALIFTRRGKRLRPISCRPMRKNERRYYEAAVRAKNG